jgi:hypothetical protein
LLQASSAQVEIEYVADALVEHSHRFDLIQTLKRYFDIGTAFSEAQAELRKISLKGEGAGYVGKLLTQLARDRNYHWMPAAIAESLAKLVGVTLGKNFRNLPLAWTRRIRMHPHYPALAAQTLPPNEVILVDNGSRDGSIDYVNSYHPHVTLVRLKENIAFSGGNIAGLEAATGDYVVLLNNDTKPLESWLERLVGCADAHPDVGIVASHLTAWEGRYTDAAGDGCTVTGRGFKLHEGERIEGQIASGYVFSACAGAALYKRRTLEEVGFLEPGFFMNAEDTDLAFRALLAAGRSTFVRARSFATESARASKSIRGGTFSTPLATIFGSTCAVCLAA